MRMKRALPRLWRWQLATVVLLALVWLLAPQQVAVTLYKVSLISLAGVLGYWLDRGLFPYARPDSMMEPVLGVVRERMVTAFAAAQIRRALIVSAAMIAVGLGA